MPLTTVTAPLPSSTKRKAFIEWRCGRADLPGNRTWIAADTVRIVASSSGERERGLTSERTLRSTASGDVILIASPISGRMVSQRHTWDGSGCGGGLCAVGLSHSGTRCASRHAARTAS